MAYAIIRSGGKQFRVEPGATLRVPSLAKQAGDAVEFDVLVSGGEGETKIGSPLVDGVRVTGIVVGHGRGEKVIVYKFKRRKQYRRKQGHRQDFTTVKIDAIG
ncbi:MAG TPA: 50S ribosomal protein L21 [Pyrinomonadaceae bacterium]|jgi:large subunit ribosomal protein L21|nr:50S ribosomal protein L21 [Pyrinomonadaceae bacterium]